MNEKKLQQLEKDSIYTIRVNPDIKDQVVSGYLNELNKVIKTNVKNKELVILVIKT
jgi:hypothetical protein